MFNKEIGQFMFNAVDAEVKRTGVKNAKVALEAVEYLEATMKKVQKAEEAATRKKAKAEAAAKTKKKK